MGHCTSMPYKADNIDVMNSDINSKMVFFLNHDDKLPAWYFYLSRALSSVEIQLIPLRLDQLHEVVKNKEKVHLICHETSLAQKERVRNHYLRILNVAVKNHRYTLYHFSSFDEFTHLTKYKYQGNYHYYKLPCRIDLIAEKMRKHIIVDSKEDQNWPGGRRAGIIDFE